MPQQPNEYTIPAVLFDFKDVHGRKPGSITEKRRALAKQLLGFIQRKENITSNSQIIEWLTRAETQHKLEEVVWYLKQLSRDNTGRPASGIGTGPDPIWG